MDRGCYTVGASQDDELNKLLDEDGTNESEICIVIVGVLSHLTVIQRLLYARKVIGSTMEQEESE